MIARKLTVFGASGGTGTQLVRQALGRELDVEAVVRERSRLPIEHPRLTVTVADVLDPAAIEPAVADADAVLSALGPRKGDSASITADAIASIAQAMKAAGVRRIVAISAAPIAPVAPVDPFVYKRIARPLLWRFFGAGYRALAAMEETLAASGLDWTVTRPALLTDGPLAGEAEYVLDYSKPGGFRISRADLADTMLRVLDDPHAYGRYVRFR
ncbi:MAG: NAD(P)-dependent oxidoreductase [Actinocrinis sp.]